MGGVGGYSSWRWIFILEGLITILVGIAAFFFVTDFPAEAKWLTDGERRHLVDRSEEESGEGCNVGVSDVKKFFYNPRKVLGALLHFGKNN